MAQENNSIATENILNSNSDQVNKTKRGRKSGQKVQSSSAWPIDKCIQLLEKRKDMEDDFINIYHKKNAWKKLIQELGWSNTHREVAIKFKNIINYRASKMKKGTGQESDYENDTKMGQLLNLVKYFIDNNHKFRPPKVIDTGADIEEPVINQTQEAEIIVGNDDFDAETIVGEEPNDFLEDDLYRLSPSPPRSIEDVSITTDIIEESQPQLGTQSSTSHSYYQNSANSSASTSDFGSQASSQPTTSQSSAKRKGNETYTTDRNKRKRSQTNKDISSANQKQVARMTDLFETFVELAKTQFERQDRREEERLKLQKALLKSKGILNDCEENHMQNDNVDPQCSNGNFTE